MERVRENEWDKEGVPGAVGGRRGSQERRVLERGREGGERWEDRMREMGSVHSLALTVEGNKGC